MSLNSLRIFLRLVTDIRSVVGGRYALYLALMTLTGLLEGVTLASVVPLLAAVGVGEAGAAAAGGKLGGLALTLLSALGLDATLVSIAVVVLSALIFSSLLFLLQSYVGASLQTTYVYRWQQRLISGIFGSRWRFFLQHRHGDLINAVITEAPRLGGAFYQAGLLLTGIIHGVIFLAVAAALSGWTTSAVFVSAAVLFIITRPLIQRAYRIGKGISRENAELQSMAGEFVSGAKLLKATATEGEAIRLLAAAADRMRSHVMANAFDVQIVKGVFDFGAAVIVAGILVASHKLLRVDPSVTLVILAIFVRLMPKLTGLQQSLQALTLSLPVVVSLQSLAAEAEAEQEMAAATPLPAALREGALAIEMRDIRICHGEVSVLDGISLEIPAGSCVAFVGASGAGKSTLVDALLGIVPASGGTIAVNGMLLPDLPLATLRRRIGYMAQDTVLYNGSIRDNIIWGQARHDDEAVCGAARLAAADQFISRLGAGYDTPVGDRGLLLSGGERQRLGLARALLGDPGLLILDEATSALDAETEEAVIRALESLKGRVTILIIAHRLSTVRVADRIHVIERGRIVESGSWEELLRKDGSFRRLWGLQASMEMNREHLDE